MTQNRTHNCAELRIENVGEHVRSDAVCQQELGDVQGVQAKRLPRARGEPGRLLRAQGEQGAGEDAVDAAVLDDGAHGRAGLGAFLYLVEEEKRFAGNGGDARQHFKSLEDALGIPCFLEDERGFGARDEVDVPEGCVMCPAEGADERGLADLPRPGDEQSLLFSGGVLPRQHGGVCPSRQHACLLRRCAAAAEAPVNPL